MPATLAPGLSVQIGRRRYPVSSIAEASRMFCAARDRSGNGASRTPTPLLFDGDGTLVGYISYNGRVWPGLPQDWTPESKPLWLRRAMAPLMPGWKGPPSVRRYEPDSPESIFLREQAERNGRTLKDSRAMAERLNPRHARND